ncbi:hypothetical protein ACLOJK_003871, partial [Asimina triloba]
MSRRTVADVLMGAARAAAAQNKTQSQSQPHSPSKKQKTQGPTDPPKLPDPSPPKALPAPAKDSPSPPVSVDDRIASLRRKASEFKPSSAAFWKEGQPVPFLFLARALDLISSESGRIVITEILCNVFRTVMATTPGDLVAVVYLSANKIAPAYEGVELGIGDASLIKALAEACGSKEEHIKNKLK